MKRLTALLCAISALTMCYYNVSDAISAPAIIASAESIESSYSGSIDNISWSFDIDTHTLTINGEGAIPMVSDPPWNNFNINDIVIGEGITSICNYAFKGRYELNSITLPSTLKEIKTLAFNFTAIKNSVVFPESLEVIYHSSLPTTYDYSYLRDDEGFIKIGKVLFEVPNNLVNYVTPDDITFIADKVFKDCTELSSIMITDNVKGIGFDAFAYCSKLETVSIGKGVETIGDGCFSECVSLKSIIIPGNVKSVYDRAFSSCSSLSSVIIEEGVEELHGDIFRACFKLTDIVLPRSIHYLNSTAFDSTPWLERIPYTDDMLIADGYLLDCRTLEENIVIPDGVLSIGTYALLHNSFSSILIPKSVHYLPKSCFINHKTIVDIHVDSDNPYYTDLNGVLYTKDMNTLLYYPTGRTDKTYVVPEGTIHVDRPFAAVNNLTTISLPSTLEDIVEDDFNSLRDINLIINNPNTLIQDRSHTFSSTVKLFAHAGSTAQAYAEKYGIDFYELSDESIGTARAIDAGTCGKDVVWVFYDNGTLDISGTGVMTDFDSYADTPWSGYAIENVVVRSTSKGTVTTIGRHAFEGLSTLKSMTLPEGLQRLRNYCFTDCENLSEINFPQSLVEFGNDCFRNCISLTSAVIGPNIASIYTPFIGCTNLASIDIDPRIMTLNKEMFTGTKWLEDNVAKTPMFVVNGILLDADTCRGEVVVPEGVKIIGAKAFTSASKAEAVVLPKSTESIRIDAFDNCNSIKSVTINSKDCTIFDGSGLIDNAFNRYKGYLLGYPKSTTEAFAIKYTMPFIPLNDPIAVIKGDVNLDGSVDILDVIMLNKSIFGKYTLNDEQKLAADTNNDGMPDSTDSLRIMKFIVELIDEL